jgi:predicted TIM-barrel fold metal-dependent hydrolase
VNGFVTQDKRDGLARTLGRFPRLPVVDHCLIARPGPGLASAVADMMRLAKFANACAQVSFLPLGSVEGSPVRDLHEPCQRIINAYGPERCVWGSNFPCDLWSPKSTYAQNLRMFTHELSVNKKGAHESILGRTAQRLWFRGRG